MSARLTLETRRARIVADLKRIEDSLDDPMPNDWEDRASERQGDEVLEAMGLAEQTELRMIDAALARVDAGTYGECTQCAKQISPQRLALLPATPFCKTCAANI